MSASFEDRMKEFPCNFNLLHVSKVSSQRLKLMKYNVTNDFSLDCCQDEIIRNKNLLTWILFKLDEKKGALALNAEVLTLTKRRNLTALGNLVFLSRKNGYLIRSETNLHQELLALKEDEDYEQLRYNALAEQAYSYGRLGGLKYQKQSAELFQQCIKECQDNYIWKFGLGLVYRRLTNYNLHCSSTETIDVADVSLKCAQLLLEVGEKGNDRYKGLAYSQLVCLRQHMRSPEYNAMFNNLNIWKLCQKALDYGPKNPSVLTQCGKCFKSIDIDKAIDHLRQSVKLQGNSVNYHHLGLSLVKKANLLASGKYSRRESNPKSHRQRTYGPLPSATYAKNEKPRKERSSYTESEHLQVFQDSGIFSGKAECSLEGHIFNDVTTENVHQNTNRSKSSHQCRSNNIKTDKRFHLKPVNKAAPLSANQNKTRPILKNSLSLPSLQKNPGNVPKDITTKIKHQLQSSKSEGMSCSPFDNKSLKPYAISPIKSIDINNELVKEAIECYEKSIEISHDENVPAKLCLADIFFKAGQYEEALANYNQIIDHVTSEHLITIITAHEYAGKSLQNLSENSKESGILQQQAKVHFTKAITLAADMAFNNPQFKNCEIEVWDSFITMMDDTKNMSSLVEKNKQTLQLLELVRNYKDIVDVVEDLLKRKELDRDSFVTGLKSYLLLEDCEEAILFLNMASTNKDLTQSESWTRPDVLDLRWKTYIRVSWSRLQKGSAGYKRVLQQMFQLKYGQCSGMVSSEVDDEDTVKHDVLIVNDESADDEEGQDATSILAHNLYTVCKDEFGLDSFRNLMNNSEFGHCTEEIQLKEMESYSLVLLILGDNDSEPYNRMLEAVHFTKVPNVLVVNLREKIPAPQMLQRCPFLNITDDMFIDALLKKDFHLVLKLALQRRRHFAKGQCGESISKESHEGHCNEPKIKDSVESQCNESNRKDFVEGQCNETNSEDIKGAECKQTCGENPDLETFYNEPSSKDAEQLNESTGREINECNEPTSSDKKDTFFYDYVESLIRLFCFLVQENFDNHREILKTKE